jgi:galactose mutarotase-like enzyme
VGRSFTDEQIERARRTGKEPSMGRYRIGNREYDMPCHGFVMSRRWALEDIRVTGDGAEITCSVASADASRGVYPFDFRLLSTVSLSGPVLRWQVRVEASPGNTRPMPFSIGNHISLNFPFTRSGRWDKGILRGTATREYGITDISLLDGSSRPLDFRRGLRLADPALCNLVTGGFRAAPVLQLIQPGTLGVRVSQEFPSRPGLMPHRYFVLWGERGKRYFCPEPWLGGPNSLNTREGAVQLAPGGCFTWTMVVEVREDVSAVTPAR